VQNPGADLSRGAAAPTLAATMIISHRLRCIFFAIPKTGTHSVRQALRRHMAEDDLEQVGLFVQKRFPFEQLKDVRHGHLSVRQIAPVIGPEIFGSYFKFGFVRNPYARFVSYCAFMGRETGHFEQAPREFMHWILFRERPDGHILFRPQHEFLIGEDGALAVDFVGRNETMQASYDAVCARLAIDSETLGRVNPSKHGAWLDYYDQTLLEGVADYYRRDFELFNYALDPRASLLA